METYLSLLAIFSPSRDVIFNKNECIPEITRLFLIGKISYPVYFHSLYRPQAITWMADRSTHQVPIERKRAFINEGETEKKGRIFSVFSFSDGSPTLYFPLSAMLTFAIYGYIQSSGLLIARSRWVHTHARPVGNKGFLLIGSFASYVLPKTAKSNPWIYHINYINASGGPFPPIWRQRGGDIVKTYCYHWYTVAVLSLNELYYEF